MFEIVSIERNAVTIEALMEALAEELLREDLLDRICERLWFEPNTDCWLITGWDSGNGYGKISYKGKAQMVHRMLYELLIGPIPEGLVLDHVHCQTRCCCNPWHLEPVTVQVNTHRGEAVLFGGI